MKTQVLILCTGNSARSQMAEGLLRTLAGDKIDVYSAGTNPSELNPFAVQAMEDRGIDISGHTSEHVDKYLTQEFDYVITVCDNAAETCPAFPGKVERIHWSFPDPSDTEGEDSVILESFIHVRNGLETKLAEWVETLD